MSGTQFALRISKLSLALAVVQDLLRMEDLSVVLLKIVDSYYLGRSLSLDLSTHLMSCLE